MFQYISPFPSGSAGSKCTGIELLVGASVKVSFEGLDKMGGKILTYICQYCAVGLENLSLLITVFHKILIFINTVSYLAKNDIKVIHFFALSTRLCLVSSHFHLELVIV